MNRPYSSDQSIQEGRACRQSNSGDWDSSNQRKYEDTGTDLKHNRQFLCTLGNVSNEKKRTNALDTRVTGKPKGAGRARILST